MQLDMWVVMGTVLPRWSVVTKCAYLISLLHIRSEQKIQICNNWYAHVKSDLKSLPTLIRPKGGPRCIFCEYSERVSREPQNSICFLYFVNFVFILFCFVLFCFFFLPGWFLCMHHRR